MAAFDDISTYRSMLRIQKHRLDEELELQAELLHKISEHVVISKSRSLDDKDSLERLEGQIYSDAKEDNPKATVAELNGITQNDADRIAAFKKYQRSRHEQEDWEGLHEAWKARGFAIRALVDLSLASYYTSESRGKDHQEGRKALNAARITAAQEGAPRRRTLMD